MRKFVLALLAVLMVAVLIGCSTPEAHKPSDSVAAPDSGKTTVAPRDQEVMSVAREIEAKVGDIYFAFDKYDLNATSKSKLKTLAGILSKNNVPLTVEGNCDERGTKEYNLALGDKRAVAAKQYLISLGISSSRISTISYGKEKPICTESNEACWAKNRRDHFVVPE